MPFDAVNMFPNIDNERGISTLRSVFERRTSQTPPTDCLIEALRICLYSNNSIFNNKHLLQENGTATGAPNSCSYYRDDCFVLGLGSEERLHQFFNFMNTLDEKLKFTMELGGDTLTFLDLKLSKDFKDFMAFMVMVF